MTILCVDGIVKRYGARTVGPVSFMLAAGETGLVIGGSGSGKSTLLDLIYGTRTATAGTVILQVGHWWHDLFALSVVEFIAVRNSAIGYCSQFLPAIPGGSGLDLAWRAGPGATVEAVFERLALPPRIRNLPVSSWSGGEKQRLNIALAALDRALHPLLSVFLTDLAEEGTAVLMGLSQFFAFNPMLTMGGEIPAPDT